MGDEFTMFTSQHRVKATADVQLILISEMWGFLLTGWRGPKFVETFRIHVKECEGQHYLFFTLYVKGNTTFRDWLGNLKMPQWVQICQDVPWLKSITKMKAACICLHNMPFESHGLTMQKRIITDTAFSISCLSGWWFGTFFIFPYIGNFIIPTDIFQRGRLNHQPVLHLRSEVDFAMSFTLKQGWMTSFVGPQRFCRAPLRRQVLLKGVQCAEDAVMAFKAGNGGPAEFSSTVEPFVSTDLWLTLGLYPLVMTNIAIENGHL
jgi:hypothetical protein